MNATLAGMRVLAFCDYFTLDSCGGSERVAAEVYRRLVSWGADVTLVTATPRRSRRAPAELVPGVRVLSVGSVDLSRVTRAQFSVAPALRRRVPDVARRIRPRVLHANGLYFQTSLAAASLARSTGLPLVTTAHVAGHAELPHALRVTTRVYERTLGRYVLRASDRAIAVSHSVVRDLRSLGVPPDRIDVVANGVDHERFSPSRDPFSPSPANRRDETPTRLVFVGRLIANKGPHLLLEALRLMGPSAARFELTFVGDGPMRARLERRARRLRLAGVRFTGPIQDVERELRRADVFVRPSYTEGLPLAVLEALGVGLCVVVSDIPGNSDLVRDGVTGLLHRAGDAAALAARLEWSAEHLTERRRIGEAGRREAMRYSWDECARRTGAVLSAAAHVPASGAP